MGDEEIKNMHWSEIIAKKVAEEKERPYVVMAGITPSGPIHPGTLCEFLFAYAISRQLAKYGNVHYIFVSDDLDALDAVPEPLKEYESVIKEDMGMPLAYARDPKGCHDSFAGHFIAETKEMMKRFGVEVEFVRASKLYAQGRYDSYARMLCERKDEIKEIVRKSLMKEALPDDWFPILPICEKCVNVDKNVVLEYRDGWYRYKCNKCGYVGEDRIENHRYKLLFRIDWPTRQKFMHVVVEGGSVDHHTRGGTIDTLVAVHREFYKEDPPYMYKFGFLKYHGKKYSKSKGIGHTVNELLELLPVEIIKYMLFKPDVQEDKELAIDKETLFAILDDYKHAAEVSLAGEAGIRADRKRAIAFGLCDAGTIWKADIHDMIMYYNIYRNWNVVGQLLGDKGGVDYLKKYIETWIKRGLIPDRYMFEVSVRKSDDEDVVAYAREIDNGMNAEDLHNLVFEVAKKRGIEPKELFKKLYLHIIGKEMGPRIGKLIYAVGVERVKSGLLK
ncbi:MAG: lysine--tRNA ligase [Candidatus Micrarchaeia archaeon]